MADGKGCKCEARSESECGCDADWTPQEVYDLRSEAELLRVRITVLETAIRRMAEQDATLSVCDGNVTVTIDATLTDEEREAVFRAINRCRGNASARKMSGMDATEDLRDAELLGKFVWRLK